MNDLFAGWQKYSDHQFARVLVIYWRPGWVNMARRLSSMILRRERARSTVAKLQQEGIRAGCAPFNVTQKQDIDAAIDHIEKDIGPIVCW